MPGREQVSGRQQVIAETIDLIRAELQDEVSVATLEAAKTHLVALAQRSDLFDPQTFPLPSQSPGDGPEDFTYLVHVDDDGCNALYVCTSWPGAVFGPHDHGGSWAVIAAVTGQEVHRFYDPEGPVVDGMPTQLGEVCCQPGTAVSMLPDGAHAIEAVGDQPLVHLHLYGLAFQEQGDRWRFDPSTGASGHYPLEDLSWVDDHRALL